MGWFEPREAERGCGRPVRSVGPADPVGWPVRSVEVRVAIHNNDNNNTNQNKSKSKSKSKNKNNTNNNDYTSDPLVVCLPQLVEGRPVRGEHHHALVLSRPQNCIFKTVLARKRTARNMFISLPKTYSKCNLGPGLGEGPGSARRGLIEGGG